MRTTVAAAWFVAAVCWTWTVSAEDGPMHTDMYQQWIMRRVTFALVNGRVVNAASNGWMYGVPRQLSTNGPVRESVSFNGNGATGSIAYSYQRTAPEDETRKNIVEEFVIEISSEGRFVLRYSDKDKPASYFELSQLPGQPVRLSLPPADKPRVIEAPTIWHLLIVHEKECRQSFLPKLEAMRDDWRVGTMADSIEEELVKLASTAQKPDRQQWAAWVDQLGDPAFYQRRERAEKKLHDVGPVVLGYLTRLKMDRLDAEQQFRVRRIIRTLTTQQGEDTPENVAALLISDPKVWLSMLARGDEATRQAAVQQLEVLLNGPVKIDPKADPETQAKARDELRGRIEKMPDESKR